MDVATLTGRLLDVIEHDIMPLTRQGVAAGNKLFGAAILRKSDLSLVLAATNNETENPLWHGEIHAIKRFYELPAGTRPAPSECLFLATHEPCSLCLSGITWAGFDNFYYLFPYEQTRDAFGIPHDIRILEEVYAVPDPDRDRVGEGRPLYNRANGFFTSNALGEMIDGPDHATRQALTTRVAGLAGLFGDLSSAYIEGRGKVGIPLA